ncbi:MAG: hypothetical protein LUD72_05895, partial [Bacteroidales bacterium]|nr:hypothetical protein [Bacteroidales bacterium]
YDRYDNVSPDNATVGVELSILTRAVGEHEGYEIGTEYENYIDISKGDYRIYFFTYDPSEPDSEDANNKLIAEFHPSDLSAVSGSGYTEYSMSGAVDETVIEHGDFKVVVLANWGEGHYPTELMTISEDESGATTIDDLCNGENSTFLAETFLTGVDADHLIPFFGLHEYSGNTWEKGERLKLDEEITMLRAVAKVEVVMDVEGENVTFEDVSICGYNAEGYCAPSGVYLQNDYDSGYTNWDGDFVNTLHLVNTDAAGAGINDEDATGRTVKMSKAEATAASRETWTCYLPEYNNMDTDFCYITVKFDYQTSEEEPYKIYFANYTDGTTSAYDGTGTDDRYDILRNHLYRFTVSISGTVIQVHVDKWEDTHDNDFVFDIEPEYQ